MMTSAMITQTDPTRVGFPVDGADENPEVAKNCCRPFLRFRNTFRQW